MRVSRPLSPGRWLDARLQRWRAATVFVEHEMSTDRDERPAKLDARDNRRWFIGVAISIVFGLFGVVMALLSYSARTPTPSPAKVLPPRGAAEPRRSKPRGERNR